ncbi:MAG TPA: hypothetical protein VFA15_03965, partial [Nitrososphaera sp.]|nr:hypothetical protein [Nitrososphaera sp.]
MLQIAVAHETAGDKAREHHLFDSAARHIQDALNIAIITPGDRQRLLAKLSEVSHYTTNPVAANTWNAGVLTSYLNDIETTEKVERAVQLLLYMSYQMWLEARGQEALRLREQAFHMAKRHGTDPLRKLATLRLVNQLVLMGRFDEAEAYLDGLGPIASTEDPLIRRAYHLRKGTISAMRGLAIEAYDSLEKALHLAKADPNIARLPSALSEYTIAATALGD